MKVFEEIGIRKAIRFIFYSFLQLIYHLVIDHFLPFPPTRKLLLQILGAKIGTNSILMDAKFFNWHHLGPKGLKVGQNCFIGDQTLIDLYDSVAFENHVTLGQRVLVLTHTNVGFSNHPLQKYFPRVSKGVVFKSGCFVGAGSIILPGVTIGENAFIGAGSVVTTNVAKDSVYAGVPAKLIRKIK